MNSFKLFVAFILVVFISFSAFSQSFPPQLSDFVNTCQPGVDTVEDFLEQCTSNPIILEVDVEACSWPVGSDFQLGLQAALGNNMWTVENGAGLDLNGTCYLSAKSLGAPSVTELRLGNMNLTNQELRLSFDFGLQGAKNTQANLKLLMLTPGNTPNELWSMPLQDDDSFKKGEQHVELPLPSNAQDASFLLVFEDFTQASAGEIEVGVDNIRIQQIPHVKDPSELAFYDALGNPNSIPMYVSLVIQAPEGINCEELTAIQVLSRDEVVYEASADGAPSTEGLTSIDIALPVYDPRTGNITSLILQTWGMKV